MRVDLEKNRSTGLERLTKTELRTLLESIKERYPNCDLETFTQRLVSRLAKIVPAETISDGRVNRRRRWAACATHSHHAHRSSKRIFRQRSRISNLDSSAKDARGYTLRFHGKFSHHLGVTLLARLKGRLPWTVKMNTSTGLRRIATLRALPPFSRNLT
jgi:hypothetical protein